ncbi:MAG: shikimate dehydrogenase [Arsenophonus sp.]|nr:MAG: shikimate dehydrogenase [Arsenophonus sp.]
MNLKEKFAIFGNQLSYTQSPFIHQLFSQQIGIHYNYTKELVSINKFEEKLDIFFGLGGRGANITSPFKELACKKVHKFTDRAYLSGSINTIKKLKNKKLLGDNTDGIGLLFDLQRLNFIKRGMHILLIGAGGASSGIIPFLLNYGCRITITNRTFSKAEILVKKFFSIGDISALKMELINIPKYDLVINATSASITGDVPSISHKIFNKKTICYDMFYSFNKTSFLKFAKENGVSKYADGIGMLVIQAAFSVKLWYGILPDVSPVLKKIEENFKKIMNLKKILK